jgi:hypothetical protein
MNPPRLWAALSVLTFTLPTAAAEFPAFKAQEIDPHVGNVCYAVTVADVDGDGKPDAVAVAEDAVYWYANPSWQKHTLIAKGATERDNVCLQPHDIDSDGKVDFALGASWQPTNTKSGGTIQWLRRRDPKGEQPWEVIPIGSEPTVHRMRWGDVLGTGKKQLIVAPLQGRGTKGPNWGEGQGVRLMVYTVPEDPVKGVWKYEVADDTLHTTHNLQVLDVAGRPAILVAGWEGVFALSRGADGRWAKAHVGSGNQESQPFKGSSEVKIGKLADGRKYVATIEPWHGHQVVVYTPQTNGDAHALWDRRVIDEPVQWGHAVWCADVDGDGDEELVIGQRDPNRAPDRSPKGPGVFIYDPTPGSTPLAFTRHVLDDGGIGCEDLVAADLNADGRPDVLAGGRSTHNVKIYWNQGKP